MTYLRYVFYNFTRWRLRCCKHNHVCTIFIVLYIANIIQCTPDMGTVQTISCVITYLPPCLFTCMWVSLHFRNRSYQYPIEEQGCQRWRDHNRYNQPHRFPQWHVIHHSILIMHRNVAMRVKCENYQTMEVDPYLIWCGQMYCMTSSYKNISRQL